MKEKNIKRTEHRAFVQAMKAIRAANNKNRKQQADKGAAAVAASMRELCLEGHDEGGESKAAAAPVQKSSAGGNDDGEHPRRRPWPNNGTGGFWRRAWRSHLSGGTIRCRCTTSWSPGRTSLGTPAPMLAG